MFATVGNAESRLGPSEGSGREQGEADSMTRLLMSLLCIGRVLGVVGIASAQQDPVRSQAAVGCMSPPTIAGCISALTDLGCDPGSPPSCRSGITAADCRGAVPVTCVAGPVLATGCLRMQVFTYSASGTGGTDSCTETFVWRAGTSLPVITLTPAKDLPCNPSTAQIADAFGTATVTGLCGGDLAAFGSVGPEQSTGRERSVTKSWTVRDSCGRTATATQTVRFKRDTVPPVITRPADVLVQGQGKRRAAASLGTATATDNGGPVKITNDAPRSPNGSLAPFPVGTTIVTWTATDACGNTATCLQKVTVLGLLRAVAYFDANGNGRQDLPVATTGESGVPGVKLGLTNGASSADGSGTAVFNVAPGAHSVSVTVPTGWINTTETFARLTVDSTNYSVTATLGLLFLCKPSRGLPPTFWAGASGANVLNANPGWPTLLNGLTCLRNADGSLHTFTDLDDLRVWLSSVTPVNMAYLLSVHLAANVLSSSYNGLGGTVFVSGGTKTRSQVCIVPYVSVPQPELGTCGSPLLTLATFGTPSACGCGPSHDGKVTIGELQLKAACLLAAFPTTVAASKERTYQECVKALLDMIDHNGKVSRSDAYPCGGVHVAVPTGNCPSPVTPSVTGNGKDGIPRGRPPG